MIIKFQTTPNKNGWTYQLRVDTDRKKYDTGSFLFKDGDVTRLTKKQLYQIITALKQVGYTDWFYDDQPQF